MVGIQGENIAFCIRNEKDWHINDLKIFIEKPLIL